MSSIVVLLPEELSTRYNGCPLKMIGHRPEISLIRGNGWSGRKHLQRKKIKLPPFDLSQFEWAFMWKNQDSIGWATDLWEKRNQDSLQVGFRSSEKWNQDSSWVSQMSSEK
ncbi:hypothetical protein RIR_jg32923.t1 [Rhizophagus irregularis DAOM 181602=DAOM 197198]|nr:hypothetical protein RIR_jg32923.t1 [Rhizophagus irregularis DAOM 181602=DAOM 197198]